MRTILLAFFFLSGICGLLYEVVWIRMAGTTIGNTTYAIGAVVAVYMVGLALGASWGGRAADRREGGRLVAFYGFLEGGVALTALAAPLLASAVGPHLGSLWGSFTVRALLFATCLVPATLFMGATLPVLSRFLSETGLSAAGEAGRAYAINSLGGVAGALAAGFWLIPSYGLQATSGIAAALNIAIAASCVVLGRRRAGTARVLPTEPAPKAMALLAAMLSGFAALVYEVAWTRALVLAVGSTVHAFSLVLGAFILGLALGSALCSRWMDRARSPAAALAGVQAGIALFALAFLPLLGNLPLRVAALVDSLRGSYERLLFAESVFIFLFVSIPAALMGAVFPLACRLAGASAGGVGRAVGAVYGWNTVGCVAGTLLASFTLIPSLGVVDTVRAAATVNLVLGAVLLAPRWTAALPALGIAATWFLVPAWNPWVVSSGSFLYGERYVQGARFLGTDVRSLLEHETRIEGEYWDAYGLVSVHRFADGVLALRINGKADASTDPRDMATQLALADVPAAHHPAPKRVLVIGLGAGLTLRAVARRPVERIDCVEISPAVVRAARHFSEANGGVLDDPRVHLVVGDGRNFVSFTRERYDLIISEPSNLWLSGMANLFTLEFFSKAAGRLASQGLFCQWIHAYRLSADDLKMVVRTFYGVFPNGSVWEISPGGDYLLLGSRDAGPWMFPQVDAGVRATEGFLNRTVVGTPGAADLLGYLVTDADGARRASGEGPILTDDRCVIEHTAPRSLYRDCRAEILGWLDTVRRGPVEQVLYLGMDEETQRKAALQREAARQMAAVAKLVAERRAKEAMRVLCAAGERLGWTRPYQEACDRLSEGFFQMALAAGDAEGALSTLRLIPRVSSWHARACAQTGTIHLNAGRFEQALASFVEAAAADPQLFEAAAGRARVLQSLGRFDEASAHWARAATLRPDDPSVQISLARCRLLGGRKAEAAQACREALRVAPGNAEAAQLLGEIEGK